MKAHDSPPQTTADGAPRRAREEGAVFLEIALMLPLLLTLLLGITTSGMAINTTNSLNNAAREAARFGATLSNDNIILWLNQVADVAIDSASGELADGSQGRYVCVAFVYPDGTSGSGEETARLVIDEAGTKTIILGQSCYPDDRPEDERRVQVLLEREADLQFVFFDSTVTLEGQTTVVFEEL